MEEVNNNSNEFFKRKEKLLYKEFDTGFSNYQKLEGKVASIRQWTITLNVAFVIYTLERCDRLTPILIVALLIMLLIFLHELRTRTSMNFDKGNILHLENIFNTKDSDEYIKMVLEYKFRDEIISNLDAQSKLKHYRNALYKGELIVWYGAWFIVWSVMVFIKRWSTIFTTSININQVIFVIILIIFIILGTKVILKYFDFSWVFSIIVQEIKIFYRRFIKLKNKQLNEEQK